DLNDGRGAGDHFDVDERIRREPPRRLRRGRSTENEGTHAGEEQSHREASKGGQLIQILKGARWSGKVRDVRDPVVNGGRRGGLDRFRGTEVGAWGVRR